MNRLPLTIGALAATLALPAAASAYTAYAVTDLNLRACESTQCAALTVIPGGAAVNVIGTSNGWNYVTYAGVGNVIPAVAGADHVHRRAAGDDGQRSALRALAGAEVEIGDRVGGVGTRSGRQRKGRCQRANSQGQAVHGGTPFVRPPLSQLRQKRPERSLNRA